jgi:hypothetical protein
MNARLLFTITALAAASIASALTVTACDPVHAAEVDALGGEAPGVRKGPLHRPGQPCITCHDGAIGDPPAFSVAGTVFTSDGSSQPANGVLVTLADAAGHKHTATTNAAGNFYITPNEFTPVYPMTATISVSATSKVATSMTSLIGRDGSCGDCHKDPAGPSSAGHIFITTDGVTP